MKRVPKMAAALVAGIVVAVAAAGDVRAQSVAPAALPDWAYPANPPPGPFDATQPRTLAGSSRQFTQAQVEDDFAPPDWFPEDHPPMPSVVANGRSPAVKACAKCHVTNGAGHPESSDLAGLSVAYIIQQMADFRDGNRKGGRATSMLPIAKAATDEEVRSAAEYYSALKRPEWTKVVEADAVPQTRLSTGGMRFVVDGGSSEPLGNRIIELPQAPERAHLRDSRFGFVAHVPVASVARGKALVSTGADGKTLPCAGCHGADLKGAADVPHLTGRSPMYVFRQLNDIKLGTRAGANVAPMREVVAGLSQDDMLAISAYLATLQP